MRTSFPTFLKSSLTVALFTTASSALAADAVSSNLRPLGANNMIGMGVTSISQATANSDTSSFTSNPALSNSSWGHFGNWYTFHVHDNNAHIQVKAAANGANITPGVSVWRTDGEFDGGTGNTVETAAGWGVPHSFNSTGDAGDYGTWWMTDDSVSILDPNTNGGVGFTEHGVVEHLGYASDSALDYINSWGSPVLSDGNHDGIALVDFTTPVMQGWYVAFVGGADISQSGANSTIDLSVSQVPVPAAVYLFGSALVGLLATSRRKMTAQASLS